MAGGNDLPPVRVLDMRGAHHSLHPETRRALGAARKSIVLLNRRGWSNFLTCKSCGKAWECPNCDVALVLHRAEHALTCHHCGHRERVPDRCDSCGSLAVARHGAGTERVEAELRHALRVPVFRLDADTTANKDAVPELLARFRDAPEGLLLGTQMVAKGHDFPDVTLGVVLDADSTLRFPDFRAEERTFALIAQLAGRAGRGPRGGRVLVQTTSPDAPAIVAAARHDADGFLRGELERRRAWGYPPFWDLIRIVTRTLEDAAGARAAAARLAQEIEVRDTELLGPAPLFRLRNRERYQLVLKTTARADAIAAVGAAVEAAARDKAFREVNFSVDVDPTKSCGRPLESLAMSDEVHTEAHGQVAEPQDKLDPETRARREAALRLVRKYGDPVLRSRALEIDRFDAALVDEVRRMGKLMHDAYGIGLAATQVGVMHRLLVYRTELEGSVAALVNPVLEWSSKEKETSEEGCLSLPGVGVEVERPVHVRVRAQDERGERDPGRGVGPRGAGHPARDGPPGRGADPRPDVARPAQAGDARAARGARPETGRGLRNVFLGTTAFAAVVLRRLAESAHRPQLVITRPDAKQGRGQKLAPPPVAVLARELGIDVIQPEKLHEPEILERIAAVEPEVLTTCAYGVLIKEPLLSDYEMINVHPSLLPRWRGAAPIERAIMAGDAETGVAIMRVTAGWDSGAVYAVARDADRPG